MTFTPTSKGQKSACRCGSPTSSLAMRMITLIRESISPALILASAPRQRQRRRRSILAFDRATSSASRRRAKPGAQACQATAGAQSPLRQKTRRQSGARVPCGERASSAIARFAIAASPRMARRCSRCLRSPICISPAADLRPHEGEWGQYGPVTTAIQPENRARSETPTPSNRRARIKSARIRGSLGK